MKLSIKAGSTSVTVNVFIQDSSSSSGAGLSGLAFNTASLTAYYALPKAASVAITLATLAAVTTAWTSGGFKEIDATNMKGWYRLDLPNTAIASGRSSAIHLQGAANMVACPIEIELQAWDNQTTMDFGLIAIETAQSVASDGTTMTLQNGTVAKAYQHVGIRSATTGAGQTSQIISINTASGTAWVATLDPPITQPTGTIIYDLMYGLAGPVNNLQTMRIDTGTGTGQLNLTGGKVDLASSVQNQSVVAGAWDAIKSAHTVVGSFGEGVEANINTVNNTALDGDGSPGNKWRKAGT